MTYAASIAAALEMSAEKIAETAKSADDRQARRALTKHGALLSVISDQIDGGECDADIMARYVDLYEADSDAMDAAFGAAVVSASDNILLFGLACEADQFLLLVIEKRGAN